MTDNMDSIRKLVDNPLLKKGDQIVSPNWEAVDSTDILRAYVDIDLHDNFDEVSLDDATIIERMRNEGMTDAEIASYGIHFSSNLVAEGELTTWGRHISDPRTIQLYPNGLAHTYNRDLMRHLAMNIDAVAAEIINAATEPSKRLSSTLYHEIRHARQDVVDGYLEEAVWQHDLIVKMRYVLGALASTLVAYGVEMGLTTREGANATETVVGYLTVVLWMIGSISVADILESKRQFKDYLANPIEVDARQAAEDAPATVVKVVPKTRIVAMNREDMNGISRRELLARGVAERTVQTDASQE